MENKLIKRYSPRTIFQMFIGVRVVGVGTQWKLTHILKRDATAIHKVGVNISTNYVYPSNPTPEVDDEDDEDDE